MGISADLICFKENGVNKVDDLNESCSLYDFLPESLHKYIKQGSVEVVDLEYYRREFNDPNLQIRIMHHDELEFSNGAIITGELKSVTEEMNTIGYNIIRYIGGSNEFNDLVFIRYHSRPWFNWLWSMKDINRIMDNRKLIKQLKEDAALYEPDQVYIDLNY